MLDENERDLKVEENTEQQHAAVQKCRDWFLKDKDHKDFYVKEMDENDKLNNSKHWDIIGPNGNPLRSSAEQAMRPNAIENIAFALVAGTVSEFAQSVDLVDFPVEPSDDAVAKVLTDLKMFIADKNHLKEERIDWLWNYFGHGTGIWETVWDPTWRGGRGPNRWVGEVRWRSVHPRAIFPDARCGRDIHMGRRIHKTRYVTLEYIREKYPRYGAAVMDDMPDEDMISSDDDVNTPESQEDRTMLVETWYMGAPQVLGDGEQENGSGLHVIWWAGDAQPVHLGHANYVYYEPGEDARFPFVFRQRYPRDNSVWGRGEYYYLKQPQIVHNKTIETLLEGHIWAAIGQGFFEAGALDPKQQKELREKGTLPRMWFAVNDITKVKREYGQSMPASLLQEAQRLPKTMEQIMGRFDVSQGRTPGSVTAFRALDLLNQRAQVRLRSADVAITSGYEEVGDNINQLIYGNYTEARAYRIVSEDSQNGLVLKRQGVFRLGDVKKVYDFKSGDVAPLAGFVPPEGAVAGKDYEVYAPEMDVRCRTSQQMPSDRLFSLEVAKELYVAKLLDPQTFFDVIEHGRFPPWPEISERVLGMLQAQMEQPGGAIPGAQDAISDRVPEELRQIVNAMSPDEAADVLSRVADMTPDEQSALIESYESGRTG